MGKKGFAVELEATFRKTVFVLADDWETAQDVAREATDFDDSLGDGRH